MWKSGTTSDKSDLVVALAGQPNCGKSTIFNAVAGFKVNTGNFSGTTVSFTETDVYIGGRTISSSICPARIPSQPTTRRSGWRGTTSCRAGWT